MQTKLIFGYTDIHWSSRDKNALAVAQKAQEHLKPDVTVVGGDLLNCGPFSRHAKIALDEDLGYDLVESELDPANGFLDDVQATTKGETIFLEGNHEAWFEKWIVNNPRVGTALRSLRPSRYLSRGRPRFKYHSYANTSGLLTTVKLHPRLIVVHGWAANKYAADRHLQLAKPYSVIYHHTHRMESRVTTMCDGKSVGAWSAGCLCELAPVYAHGGSPTEWSHGFWIAHVGKAFTVYNIPILGNGTYCVLPSGKEIKV